MTPDAYALLRRAEASWWYRGRREVVMRALRCRPLIAGPVLDFGAGYGGMSTVLSTYGPVTAYEPFDDGASVCVTKDYVRVVRTQEELRVSSSTFALCGAFDVLEHTPNDREALRDISRCLIPTGTLVLTVPAYPWLWGPHDVSHAHFRRYTATSLRFALESEGFRVLYIGYWNCFLFLPFLVVRFFQRGGEGAMEFWEVLQRLLFWILRREAAYIPNLRFPFGSSVICVAEKIPT